MENLIEEVISENMEILKLRGITNWTGSKFEPIKLAAKTHGGDFGESTASEILTKLGYPSKVVNGGKGSFDILLAEKILLEHKLATEDTKGYFQFNGIKKNVKFDYVFCLGVSPDEFFFTILSKNECQGLTTSMTKKDEKKKMDSFKYMVRKKNMIPLTVENLKKEIEKIVK